MANQELNKLVDVLHKREGAWRKQMRIEGFTKREELTITDADPNKMSPISLALFREYQEAHNLAEAEAKTPSQPSLEVHG